MAGGWVRGAGLESLGTGAGERADKGGEARAGGGRKGERMREGERER